MLAAVLDPQWDVASCLTQHLARCLTQRLAHCLTQGRSFCLTQHLAYFLLWASSILQEMLDSAHVVSCTRELPGGWRLSGNNADSWGADFRGGAGWWLDRRLQRNL